MSFPDFKVPLTQILKPLQELKVFFDAALPISSTTYASLSDAVTAIGATPTSLVITNAFPSGANCTVPSTLTLRFVSGGSLAGSDTVNIQGPIIAPARPIFATTLTLVFTSNRYIAEYPINWFGVLGNWNGTTGADDTTAFQLAIESLPQHGTLRVPPNMRIRTTAPLRIWTKQEISVIQTGASYYGDAQTWIDYLGPDSSAAVQIYNSFGCLWDGVKIRLNYGVAIAQIGIDIDQFPDATVIDGRAIAGSVCSQNTAQNTNILTMVNNGPNFYGVRIAFTSAVNCEMIIIKNVHVIANGTGFTTPSNVNRGTAFYISGANALNIVIEHCSWTFVSYGIRASRGARISDCEGQYATIDIQNAGDGPMIIDNTRVENGRQFFTGIARVTMIGNHVAFGNWDAAYPLIKATGPATLILIGNSFDIDATITNVDNNTAHANRLVTIGNTFGGPVNYQNFSGGAVSIVEGSAPLIVTGSDQGYGAIFLLDTKTQIVNLGTLNSTNGGLTYASDALPSNSKTGLVGGNGTLLLRQAGAWVAITPTYSGSETMPGAATITVTFSTAFANASYKVTLAGNIDERFWVTSKTVNGFTINSSNVTSTAVVDWILTR